MADIKAIAKRLSPEDVMPNYELQIQDLAIDFAQASNQKQYLEQFIRDNFEVLETRTHGMDIEGIQAYLMGAKDMLAFVNLWIDSLNVMS